MYTVFQVAYQQVPWTCRSLKKLCESCSTLGGHSRPLTALGTTLRAILHVGCLKTCRYCPCLSSLLPRPPSLFTLHPSQGALEEVTEMLAEVVARPHLRKPRSEIIRLTREAREKRLRLVRDIKAGLP